MKGSGDLGGRCWRGRKPREMSTAFGVAFPLGETADSRRVSQEAEK